MKKGDRVKMTQECKDTLKRNGCNDHVHEFGNCVGIVQEQVRGPNGDVWPEWDVRWQPSNLRYAYHPASLVIVG
jgi:hypothetical protein